MQGDQSLASMSMLAAQLPSLNQSAAAGPAFTHALQRGRSAVGDARLEMGISARQHLIQLSLRLDYNGFFTGSTQVAGAEAVGA
jgi:hypothetical protein